MKKSLLHIAAIALLVSFSASANAATLVGTFLDDAAWSLIHGGSSPGGTTAAGDNLRWDPNQEIIFDLTGTTLTASGPQAYSLASTNGDTATFTLQSMTLDLDHPSGFNNGTMDYDLVVNSGPLAGSSPYSGTFSFIAQSFSGFPFNSSGTNNGVFELYIWGGDVANDLGIDVGISAPIPLPAPLLLFGTGLFSLGLLRRK